MVVFVIGVVVVVVAFVFVIVVSVDCYQSYIFSHSSVQGKENDIIIVSLVRSNKSFTIGFLSSMNRLCVAISRAKCALYLFGNSAALSSSSRQGWKVGETTTLSNKLSVKWSFKSTNWTFKREKDRNTFSLQQSTGYLSGRSLVLSVETLKKRPAAGERAGACGKWKGWLCENLHFLFYSPCFPLTI